LHPPFVKLVAEYIWKSVRERLIGELRWNRNMEVYGEGGALFFLLEPLGRGCGRISRKGGIIFLALLDLRWDMAPRSAFGVTSGVGKWFLR
jgi:hypothetical protein